MLDQLGAKLKNGPLVILNLRIHVLGLELGKVVSLVKA
jgi:hypothetical protein